MSSEPPGGRRKRRKRQECLGRLRLRFLDPEVVGLREHPEPLSGVGGVNGELEGLGLANGGEGKVGMQRLGAVRRCTRAVIQGAGPGPSSEGSGRFQDSRGSGEHTVAKPAYLHSRKPFMGAGGRHSPWTGGKAARRRGLRSCGSTVSTSHEVETARVLLFLFLPSPTSPLEPWEGPAMGCFTQHLARPHSRRP